MIPIQDSVPSRSVPVVTRTLILINVVVFFFELGLPREAVEQMFYLFGLVPARFGELGLRVGSDMPENVMRLMQLYPQPIRRQPSVEYLPIPYRTARRSPRAGDSA